MAAVRSANKAKIEYSLKASEKLEPFLEPDGATDFLVIDIPGPAQEAGHNYDGRHRKLCEIFM